MAGSAQELWLKQDLASHNSQCTLAYYQNPRFASTASGTGGSASYQAIWQDLYAGGVDVALNGDSHWYERFQPLNGAGVSDPTYGVREFIVGTGGAGLDTPGTKLATSQVLNNTTHGVIRMTRLCLPHMDGGGHIVNLGSVAGLWAYPNGALYCVSKAAVEMFTRALREDLLGRPVRVTTVSPGLVETEFSKVRFRGDEEKAAAVYDDLAVGGPLRAKDVADCILFAVTRPMHVNVDEIVVMALSQSSGARILRST